MGATGGGCHDKACSYGTSSASEGYTGKPVSGCTFTRKWWEKAQSGVPKTPARDPSVPASPAPKGVVRWLLCPKKRTEAQTQFVARLLAANPKVELATDLVKEFFGIGAMLGTEKLPDWMKGRASEIRIVSFASGLRKDWDAVGWPQASGAVTSCRAIIIA